LQRATIYHWNSAVYLIYLTVCELPVHNIEYAADWRLVADPVLNGSPKTRLYINYWLLEGASETASCLYEKQLNPFVPLASLSVKRDFNARQYDTFAALFQC
jgi:hypothetical protein